MRGAEAALGDHALVALSLFFASRKGSVPTMNAIAATKVEKSGPA